jgi:GTP pyrophosphokinase
MDTECIVAALLHDVVEDTDFDIIQVEKRFGKDVALLVDGVTKLGKIPYTSKEEEQAENLRKMLLAMAQDIRVIIIKLADRLHNARTFDYLPEEKRRDKALETMEIYAPLADRLGIRRVKEELEDISLRCLDPIAVAEIENQLLAREERQRFLESIKKRIYDRIKTEHPNAYIEGRVKSLYGIYRKVYMQGRSFDEVFDIYAVRIIVDSVIECYNILGIIHDMFVPIPNRFKDYISTPKQNMYQSLHTTVFDKEGVPFETQIRTWDMHYTAEYGIAAHWKYKVGIQGKDKLEERLAWVRQLLETQQEGEGDVEDIVRSIKTDIAPEEVFVFTPNGDVIRLPSGATVIDFAYAIHSAVGNRMVGAKIDGHIVSVDTEVQTGNIVEILTGNKTQGPNRAWLNIVKTTEARNKIRGWFKKERREENIAEGNLMLDRELKRLGVNMNDEQRKAILQIEAKRQHFETGDDLIAALGYGGVQVSRIAPHIRAEYQRCTRTEGEEQPQQINLKPKKQKASSGVIIEGLDGCLVKFSKCCNPLPGDEIVGFVTRGYGVSIHKSDCVNVINGQKDESQKDRWVHAEWAQSTARETFQSSVEIIGNNRQGLLADLTMLLNNLHVPLHSFVARDMKDGRLGFQITMAVCDIQQLNYVISQVKNIPGVVSVERVAG